MIAALVFDLDSCLAPADEPGRQLFARAFAAIRAASEDAQLQKDLDQAFQDMWRLPFDFVAEKYQFTPAMREAGWRNLVEVEVKTPMQGYGDLSVLPNLPGAKFLVTSGFRRLQTSKVKALGAESIFQQVFIDAIDEPGAQGKQPIFERILRDNRLAPSELLVVGDNPDSELAAGHALGMSTVQILRPGVPRGMADFHVQDLFGLKDLLGRLGTGTGTG